MAINTAAYAFLYIIHILKKVKTILLYMCYDLVVLSRFNINFFLVSLIKTHYLVHFIIQLYSIYFIHIFIYLYFLNINIALFPK